MDTTTLYQHSTLADLTAGLFSGTLPVSQLLQHGNTGIGTGDGLDGELIILDGQVNQITGDGEVRELAPKDMVPFANVHFADYQSIGEYQKMDKDETLAKIAQEKIWNNIFYSFMLKGNFTRVKTRSVHKQKQPYPSLAQAAQKQGVFERENISGQMLGYYAPSLYNGVAVGGFHYHFISDDHLFGGHVLDFELNQASLGLQMFDNLVQHFPVESVDFMNFDYSQHHDIAEQISHAEK
ncbi:acetolactate decarboxylase [Convivina praedatoris]|uniref:Alpha-acetolactate decarboxylase n=1 Tax=Convivina praedatoris TaxID=2880963 RepID=A0ABN8HD51_9LACO|nr:acetolactate decarboxylase [Convivina sp. LMG 32447]CAH1851479.1 Alpha-acetolactate decarboxylase [Convivina sp. LMG 32447]CAH1853524.1 Alpha-acetolactate decarboxylase [Convivina sp. LMG 32447]CAH1854514.1 Alpha-acetolactate decarboxylase [Convivina sp. LMG 32447]